MRVIAGAYRGRRLAAPPGTATRPTSDRVREALFSILGRVDGLAVLDLFAGSGALGIEALSRGASRAVFVERAAPALAVLRKNLDALALLSDVAIVVPGDARQALRAARRSRETYDLVFLDPPYRRAAQLAGDLSKALPGVLAAGGRVVSESDRRTPLELDLALADERRYGDTVIRIHSRE
ncbi:MAG: rRNA (guanine966-N2)-methyltransferase [Solirubrobacteraceae bacterium]|nr:rRNA (guanine966-N2)-methyltransferase [Solirubrobacteraceae bacterium]